MSRTKNLIDLPGETMLFVKRKNSILSVAFSAMIGTLSFSCPAFAESHLFDEIRIMPNLDVGHPDRREKGGFINAMLLFDPLDSAHAANGLEIVTRPRIHIGANVGISGDTSQIFGGFSWKVPLNELFYLDFGLGGTVHNAQVPNTGSGPDLGCSVLFHEYAGVGYQIDTHWSVTATIDHSSHASMCRGKSNQGLTHAGLAVGYKF